MVNSTSRRPLLQRNIQVEWLFGSRDSPVPSPRRRVGCPFPDQSPHRFPLVRARFHRGRVLLLSP